MFTWKPWLAGAVGYVAAAAIAASWYNPPAPLPASAPAQVFSGARARGELARLMADGAPHPVGSAANARVADAIVQRLEDLGYHVEQQTRFVCGPMRRYCGSIRNIVTHAGATGGPAVLLNSHYDTVPASPGGSDPMAGVAALLEIARILRAAPPAGRVVLLFNDGEEAGLLGSWAFVRHHPWARDMTAVINLDARGTSGPSLLATTIGEAGAMVQAYAGHAPHPAGSSAVAALLELLPNTTDLAAFDRAGVPGVLFGYLGSFRHYHTPNDDLLNTSEASLQHHGESALAMLSGLLEQAPSLGDRGGRRTFFTVGGVMVHWPLWLAPWLAAFGLAGLLAAAVRRHRVALRPWLSLLVGCLGALAIVVAGGLAGLAADKVRQVVVAVPNDWVAFPWPPVVAVWAASLAGTGAIAALLRARFRHEQVWLGLWIIIAAIGLAVALTAPGASHLATVPALLAGVLSHSHRRWLRVVPGVSMMLLVAPLFRLAPDLFGLAAPLPAAVLVAVSTAPLFVLLPLDRWRWVPAGAAAMASVMALTWAGSLPTFTDRAPQWLNLVHIEDADARNARWLSTGWPLPPAVAAAARFENSAADPVPWSRTERGPSAAAPYLNLAPPGLELVSESGDGPLRRVRLRVSPGRHAPILQLVIQQPDRLAGATVNGEEVPGDDARYQIYRAGYDALTIWTTPEEGVDVTLTIRGTEPFDVVVSARSSGLPAAASALTAARPPQAVPNSLGDSTLVVRRFTLGARPGSGPPPLRRSAEL